MVAGAGYWRLVDGKPELVGIFSGMILEHSRRTPKFWAQVRHRLSKNFDVSSRRFAFDAENLGPAWHARPDVPALTAEKSLAQPIPHSERATVTDAIVQHLRGGSEEFWFEVERVEFPATGGLSIDTSILSSVNPPE
ncbi:hypothetical protein ACIBQ0_26015 [Nocardia nova]|uniref:hypothetical protein n=1 Tax=Nocardia nova TaxID=37330 RepID=UPI0037B39505